MNVTTAIEGTEQSEFLKTIESLLRNGQADDAAAQVKSKLSAFAGEGKILPARFLDVTPQDVTIAGWDSLAAKFAQYDRPDHPITAIGIEFTDPEVANPQPDGDGNLAPAVETNFYSDSAYPFSACDLESLLDGYSAYGTEWQGSAEQVDDTLSIEGISDLHGAVVELRSEDSSGLPATPEELEAFAMGSCYIAVLVHQAVKHTIESCGMPRPLAVFVGNNDCFPFFDAPVLAACDEDGEPVSFLSAHTAQPDAEAEVEDVDPVEPAPVIADEASAVSEQPAVTDQADDVVDLPAPVEETPEALELEVAVEESPTDLDPPAPTDGTPEVCETEPGYEFSEFEADEEEEEEEEEEEHFDSGASLLTMGTSSHIREEVDVAGSIEGLSAEELAARAPQRPLTGSELRRRVIEADVAEPPRGFFARLFGRG